MAKSTTQSKQGSITVGSSVFLPAGTRFKRFGAERKTTGSRVTVRNVEFDKRSGKTRIYWKSHGYTASTLI